MIVLGLNMLGAHDATACLVKDGAIVAYGEEERFSRRKKAPGQLPVAAARYSLNAAGIMLREVDAIAIPFAVYGTPYSEAPPTPQTTFGVREAATQQDPALRKFLRDLDPDGQPPSRVFYVAHHLAHAASAFRLSGLESAGVLVADGEGDHASTTVAVARNGHIESRLQLPVDQSLGFFYTAVTTYLGQGSDGEGKTMGLAPYGTDDGRFDSLFSFTEDGFVCGLPGVDRSETFQAWLRYLVANFGAPRRRQRFYDTTRGRLRDGLVQVAGDADIAASAQGTLERALSHMATLALEASSTDALVVAGGVHLNCSANGVLSTLPGVRDFFAQPIAHDAGATLGAALEVTHFLGGPDQSAGRMRTAALSVGFPDEVILAELKRYGIQFDTPQHIVSAASELLSKGKIIGWFQGNMEAGPRALGQRSILGSPGDGAIRDRVNDIKRRARWRPLSPSLRRERANDVLTIASDASFMVVRGFVKSEWRDRLPGITHVDGSARPQVVDREDNERYWELLTAFEEMTGLPCLINTSFNDEAEPIVCSPEDALRTFYTTELDALVIGPALLIKQPSR